MINRNLPTHLYLAQQCKALDRSAIENLNIPGYQLMKRAAQSALALIRQEWPQVRSLSIWVGRGNNGGDGVALAKLAYELDWRVQLVVPQENFGEGLTGEAADAWADLPPAIKAECFDSGIKVTADLIVDAVLGIGLAGEVRGVASEMIQTINGLNKPVFSLDVPSGLDADKGVALGCAVRADATLTFIVNKPGWIVNQGAEYAGKRFWAGLGLTEGFDPEIKPFATLTTVECLRARLPKRSRVAHKGHFGVVLVVGGNAGMGGAAIMAAQAAHRAGAGRVILATRSEHISAALARSPETMVRPVDKPGELDMLMDQVDAIVLGPGLGKDAWAEEILNIVLNSAKPRVFDADALNLISEKGLRPQAEFVFTPHPAEAARLLETTTADLLLDTISAVERLHTRFGGVQVFKGAGSLVRGDAGLALCDRGNPGMATGGMGDLLSGIIGALLAQGLDSYDAARLGVWIHAVAGDKAAVAGEIGLVATDLLEELRWVMNLSAVQELSALYE